MFDAVNPDPENTPTGPSFGVIATLGAVGLGITGFVFWALTMGPNAIEISSGADVAQVLGIGAVATLGIGARLLRIAARLG